MKRLGLLLLILAGCPSPEPINLPGTECVRQGDFRCYWGDYSTPIIMGGICDLASIEQVEEYLEGTMETYRTFQGKTLSCVVEVGTSTSS